MRDKKNILVDPRISEYAPFDLEADRKDGSGRGIFALSRFWGKSFAVVSVSSNQIDLFSSDYHRMYSRFYSSTPHTSSDHCFSNLKVYFAFSNVNNQSISFRRRRRARRYSKTDDDHRQQLNIPDHQMEPPYLDSSAATILPPSAPPRPHSASSTTSSIIMHPMNDGISDRESLIKPVIPPVQSRPHGEIDNLYEEIKEQQHQTALALGMTGSKGDLTNPYLEARKSFFQGQSTVPPIRDHHEVFYYECAE